jgi:hypothetical protein
MRTLEQALYDHELIVLRVIGEWWELDLTGADKAACVKALAQTLTQLSMTEEISFLPPEEADAIKELIAEGGRLPVATFSRKHGEVRLMGPGRLEREEPWLDPASPAEALWYRGFLYRAFNETADGLIEFFYLPQELLSHFYQIESESKTLREPEKLGPVAVPADFLAGDTDAVDDLTTILAMAQNQPLSDEKRDQLRPFLLQNPAPRRDLLIHLAREMELLKKSDEGARPTRTAGAWLRLSREEQLRQLAEAWRQSSWNELCHTPELACEGSGWSNDPTQARAALLAILPRTEAWYRLGEVVSLLKESNPDFQRPEGNYDIWYIRDVASNAFITGFTNWDLVEGRLLRFLIQGPMFWLGLVDLAGEPESEAPIFRLTTYALKWLEGQPASRDEVTIPLVVQDDATVIVPFNCGRYHRFQVARISEAEPVTPGKPFQYRLTPRSLQQAREQNIGPERVLQFLAEASGRPVPTSTQRALERWSERGNEASLQQVFILRVRDAEILDKLAANVKTRPFLGERLADLAVIVASGDWQKLRQSAAQLGLLLDTANELTQDN